MVGQTIRDSTPAKFNHALSIVTCTLLLGNLITYVHSEISEKKNHDFVPSISPFLLAVTKKAMFSRYVS